MRIKSARPIKLDWYVLEEVMGPFLGGILFFSFVFLMFQALRLAEFFIIHGISGMVLGKMTALMVLSFMPTALPVAFLIGILVGFGRLSADSELVAMKANGISIWRLATPVLGIAIVVSFLSLMLSMEWVPWGERTFKQTLIRVSNTKVVSSIKEGTFVTGFFDLLIYADKLDPKTNKMYRVFIYDEREAKNPMTIVAEEGQILPVKATSQLGAAAVLKLERGNIHRNDIDAKTYQKIDFGEYKLYLKIDEGEANATIKPRMIPQEELIDLISRTPKDSGHLVEYLTEYWRRYAMAITPLLFVFLGIGFGTIRTRAVRAGAAIVALGVIIVYWAVQACTTVMAQKGWIPPALAMQLPNGVMLILAYYGFKSAVW